MDCSVGNLTLEGINSFVCFVSNIVVWRNIFVFFVAIDACFASL